MAEILSSFGILWPRRFSFLLPWDYLDWYKKTKKKEEEEKEEEKEEEEDGGEDE
jgi:hypothetical protein